MAMPLVEPVGVARDDVVRLVGHAAGLAHEAHVAGPMQLGLDDVLDCAAGVADLEPAGDDAAHSRRADYPLARLLGHPAELAALALGHAPRR